MVSTDYSNWAKEQVAKTQAAKAAANQSSATGKSATTANTTTSTATPAPGTQASAQAWINNSASGQGGLDAYIANQQQKYNTALANNDADMLSKLGTDMQRVGYTLQTPQMKTSLNNAQSYIDALNQARKDATLAQLGKSRDAALSNLAAEQTTIQPKYTQAKNQTASGSQQQARNFAEFMAARGGTNAGSNAQSELSRMNTLQGNLGSLNQQETAAYGDIARRTSDLQNAYQSDVASATAGIEADRMQAMLTDYYNQQQRELQIAGLTGMLGGTQTLAGKSYDLNAQNQSFNQNLATNQYNQGVANDQFNQGVTMAELTGVLPNGQKTTAAQQQQLSNLWTIAQYTGKIPNEIADMYGIPRGTQTQDAISQAKQLSISQQNANTSAANASTSASSAANSANNAKINQLMDIWQATGSAPAGIPGVAAGTPYQSSSSSSSSTADPTKNEKEAELYTKIDQIPEANLKQFFKNEKGNIIASVGKSGYDQILSDYGLSELDLK